MRGQIEIGSQKWNSWQHKLLLALMAGLLLGLYVFTSLDTVTMEDSGIFLVTSYFSGIPHPTGYPLYTLLAKCFSLLPFGSVAARICLLNSLLAVFSCLLIYRILIKITDDFSASISAALMLGVSCSFWHQAIVAEVYMLNVCLFLAMFDICLTLRQGYRRKTAAAMFFLYGLGLSNHIPLLILASGAFLVLLWPHVLRILKDFWILLPCLLLGLLPYLHLVTAHLHSRFLFLYPIDDIAALWTYLTRQNYSGIDVIKTESVNNSVHFATYFFNHLLQEFSPAALPAIGLGLIVAWSLKRKSLAVALTLSFLSSSIILLIPWRTEFTMLTRDFYQYCQLIPLAACAIFFGIALAFLRSQAAKTKDRFKPLVTILGLICIVWALVGNFSINNLNGDTFAADYADLVLKHLPKNAVLLLNDDADHGPVGYRHFVEGMRPDLLVTSQVGVLFPVKPFDARQHQKFSQRRIPLLNFISQQQQNGKRIFTTEKIRYFNDKTAKFPLHYRSLGLYYEITTKPAKTISLPEMVQEGARILDKYQRGEYQQQWRFHRDLIIGKISQLLLEAGKHHPVLDQHRESLLIHAQMENVVHKNYEKADRLFSRVIHQTSGLYLARQLEIHRQFLVNRVAWTNSAEMPNRQKSELIQQAVDQTVDMAVKYPFCDNRLALNLVQLSRQVPIVFDDSNFRKRFHHCQAFQPYF